MSEATETWQLQDAKNRLSELIGRARRKGPQTITVRGQPAVVVISVEEYERIQPPATSLAEFVRESPLHGIDLTVERDKAPPRKVDL